MVNQTQLLLLGELRVSVNNRASSGYLQIYFLKRKDVSYTICYVWDATSLPVFSKDGKITLVDQELNNYRVLSLAFKKLKNKGSTRQM
jgi:hypothetical protein